MNYIKKAYFFKNGIKSYCLDAPMVGKGATNESFMQITGDAIVSTVYLSDNAIVVRVYDVLGSSRGKIIFGRDIASVTEVNMLEDKIAYVKCEADSFEYDLKAKQIKTYKVVLE